MKGLNIPPKMPCGDYGLPTAPEMTVAHNGTDASLFGVYMEKVAAILTETKLRHVATEAGVRHFGQPIDTVIVADVVKPGAVAGAISRLSITDKVKARIKRELSRGQIAEGYGYSYESGKAAKGTLGVEKTIAAKVKRRDEHIAALDKTKERTHDSEGYAFSIAHLQGFIDGATGAKPQFPRSHSFSDMVAGVLFAGLSGATKSIEDTLETKNGVRRVRDVEYWGLPYNTIILPGMKPVSLQPKIPITHVPNKPVVSAMREPLPTAAARGMKPVNGVSMDQPMKFEDWENPRASYMFVPQGFNGDGTNLLTLSVDGSIVGSVEWDAGGNVDLSNAPEEHRASLLNTGMELAWSFDNVSMPVPAGMHARGGVVSAAKAPGDPTFSRRGGKLVYTEDDMIFEVRDIAMGRGLHKDAFWVAEVRRHTGYGDEIVAEMPVGSTRQSNARAWAVEQIHAYRASKGRGGVVAHADEPPIDIPSPLTPRDDVPPFDAVKPVVTRDYVYATVGKSRVKYREPEDPNGKAFVTTAPNTSYPVCSKCGRIFEAGGRKAGAQDQFPGNEDSLLMSRAMKHVPTCKGAPKEAQEKLAQLAVDRAAYEKRVADWRASRGGVVSNADEPNTVPKIEKGLRFLEPGRQPLKAEDGTLYPPTWVVQRIVSSDEIWVGEEGSRKKGFRTDEAWLQRSFADGTYVVAPADHVSSRPPDVVPEHPVTKWSKSASGIHSATINGTNYQIWRENYQRMGIAIFRAYRMTGGKTELNSDATLRGAKDACERDAWGTGRGGTVSNASEPNAIPDNFFDYAPKPRRRSSEPTPRVTWTDLGVTSDDGAEETIAKLLKVGDWVYRGGSDYKEDSAVGYWRIDEITGTGNSRVAKVTSWKGDTGTMSFEMDDIDTEYVALRPSAGRGGVVSAATEPPVKTYPAPKRWTKQDTIDAALAYNADFLVGDEARYIDEIKQGEPLVTVIINDTPVGGSQMVTGTVGVGVKLPDGSWVASQDPEYFSIRRQRWMNTSEAVGLWMGGKHSDGTTVRVYRGQMNDDREVASKIGDGPTVNPAREPISTSELADTINSLREDARGGDPETALRLDALESDAAARRAMALRRATTLSMAKEPLSDIAPPREDREAFRAFAIAHDTRSADIYRQRMELTDSMERDYDTIRRMAGQEIVGYGRDRRWNGKVEDAIATLWADVEEATRNGDHNLTKREGRRGFTKTNDAQRALERIDAKKKELLELDLQREHERQVMADAGGWSQAFLAVTNGDGHVHSSMVCPTCNRGKDWTRFAWMVEYSGANEEEIVDAAGVRACTVCYPSAPVESLNKPTRMFTPDEVEKAKAREEREAAKIAKDAKKKANAATPDGSELRISTGDGYTERFSTESSAMSWATGHYYNFMSEHDENGVYPEWMDLRSGVTQIAESIAAKRGVPVEEVMAEIIAKADAKAKKSVKERAAWRAQNPNFA